VKANQKTLHRQIRSQFQGKRHIPFVADVHEISHGRNITWALRAKQAPEHIREAWIGTSWIMEVTASGTRDSKLFQAHLFLTSLRTTPESLLRLVRDRWSIEGWHWIRDTQFHEDAHRYRGNGAGVMATLRTAALNLLRLAGFHSIRTGLQAVMHDITALLAMARRPPELTPPQRMTGRDPLLDRDVGEQRARSLLLTSHQGVGCAPFSQSWRGFSANS
jgi:predicted transposase YbfD/YdcC